MDAVLSIERFHEIDDLNELHSCTQAKSFRLSELMLGWHGILDT